MILSIFKGQFFLFESPFIYKLYKCIQQIV
jgi:hypothetical protein